MRNVFIILISFLLNYKAQSQTKNMTMFENKTWVLNSFDFPKDTIKFRIYNAKKDKNEVGYTYQFLSSGEMKWERVRPPRKSMCKFRERDMFKGNWKIKDESLHIIIESGYYGEWRDKYDLNYNFYKLTEQELMLIKTAIK